MALSSESGKTQIVTRDGVVTATVLDTVSPDRIALMLYRASAGAKYGSVPDTTEVVGREIKDLLIVPFSEI